MKILWNYVGGVTANSAKVSAKLQYDYGSSISNTKVYTLTYNGSTMKVYVDNELIQEVTKEEAGMSKYSTLYFGADYDDTCWFKGLLPEIRFYDNVLSDTDRINLENYLQFKWGSNSSYEEPNITSAETFIEFNENGHVIENDRIIAWNDIKNNRELVFPDGKSLGTQSMNNRLATYFDNEVLLTLLPNDTNPDNLTLVFVAKFDDFKKAPYNETSQSLISSTDNFQFRIKKYDEDNYLSYRIRDWDERAYYLDVPEDKVLGVTMENKDLATIGLTINGIDYSKKVNNYEDFGTAVFEIDNLEPNTRYTGICSVNDIVQKDTSFTFKTLPVGGSSFKIVSGSCNRTSSTAPTWGKIKSENPDLFIHLGDLNYLDLNAINKQEYAKGLDISFSEPILDLFRSVGTVYQYDNHDSLRPTPDKNDTAWSPFIEFFTKVHPIHKPSSENPKEDGVYYSFNMGRIKCIVTDCRRARDPQRDVDNPTKSVLGINQKNWFKEELLEARDNPDIGGIIWFSQILWTADRNDPRGDSFESWGASWASYEEERTELANFIYSNKVKNLATVCADVHMQAIDDGRNSCYITDENGDRVDPYTIDKEYWIPMLEASPFDQYLDYDGGPFNINDTEGSGGPTDSSEQSYGVIEVLDRGEKWIQIKMYTMALSREGVWERNRYYTFNWNTDNGTDGIAPPLDWSNPSEPNYNGYIFKEDSWKNIQSRYIYKDKYYKPQLMQWKFIKGKWRKTFDANLHNDNEPLTISHINTWTAETENFLEIHGKGYLDVSYPPNFGGYYTFASNTGDLFGNFPYAIESGSPVYNTTDDIKCVTFNKSDSIVLPSSEGVGITFNILYDNDFFIGIWVYNNGNTDRNAVFSDSSKTYGLFTEDNKLKLNLGEEGIYETNLEEGWNKVGINVKISDSGKYTYFYHNDTVTEVLNFKVKDFGKSVLPIYFGYESSTTIANFYYIPRYAMDSQAERYIKKPSVEVIFTKNNIDYVIPTEWMMGLTNKKISLTIPPSLDGGTYALKVKSINYISNEIPIAITQPKSYKKAFATRFKSINDVKDNFYVLHKAWGGANGGVVQENITYEDNLLRLYANGDLYSGKIQGVNRDGDLKFHTHENDPKKGQPWTNRVGACMIFKHKTGFGSYKMKAKIPTVLGVCSAFWTFFYNEIYPGDPRWDEFLNEGLHPQGNAVDGYYMTRNHEIDIEFPSHLDGGVYSEPSFNNMKCNTWRGELQNWDVPKTDPTYWEEYRDNLTPTNINMYDNKEHEFRFDWYPDRVEFYIDGVLKQTNKGDTIPQIAGHFTFGLWFPSASLKEKPWLVDPSRAWAGGVIDSDGGRKAMFDRVSMDISEFSFIPFTNNNSLKVLGETYPYGTYRKYE